MSKTFLADPITMVRSGWTLLTEMGFASDIGMTMWRVVGGFVIAALIALPLGVLMGAWGGGAFGFMRSLAQLGPLTVPQIAQMRPTSRQRMQRLADDLAAEGLVEFVDNPKHQRSKLVRLTQEAPALKRGSSSCRPLMVISTARPEARRSQPALVKCW